MTFTSTIELDTVKQEKKEKFDWYWAPIFCACWFVIFYAAVIPSYHSYPNVISIKDERNHPDKFIGERAEIQLLGLTKIGVKLTGTIENEVHAVRFLLDEIDTIKKNARLDLYDIEVEVQFASGEFVVWGMATLYHNVQNVIVKIGPKSSQSTSYLLVNSHFDSEVASPAAGDAGVMIVVMLETLRVMSRSTRLLKNPVVFLLNGAEEADFLGSHGFITQHKWAKNCKALINLDSAGSGGREILFQSGPNHPWLMRYYGQSVPHPFASTTAEELFQNDFIPSDTDFRIFRDHKGVPGLDLAHAYNGYVYHTKYDRFGVLPRGTYQSTGDNVLALTRALANAEELEDPEKYSEGHTVFYDYLGWFTIYYTETTGIVINVIVSVCALIVIGVSFWLMLKEKGYETKTSILRFLAIFGVQVLAVLVAIGLTVLLGVIVDAMGLTLSWYKAFWMIFGLYYCPMFFAMGIIPAFYLGWTKNKTEMGLRHSVQLFLHSQGMILVFLTILMTSLSIRSAFQPMIGLFFYTISVILSFGVISVFKKKSLWMPIHLICTIPSFWFYTYLAYTFYNVFNAMQGRDGPDSTPELFISAITAILCVLLAGFIIPILLFFRKPKILFSLFAVLTVVFIIIAATEAGFPFEKDVAAKRYYVLHTNRVFHGYDGQILRNESGIFVQPVDPRNDNVADSVYKNANPPAYTDEYCDKEIYCGLPLYNTRWLTWVKSSRWIPFGKPNIPVTTELKFNSKTLLSPSKMHFSYTVTGPDRIVIYVDPMPGAVVSDWSFNRIPLDENYEPPYFIYYLYSVDKKPLDFWIELKRDNETWEGPTFRLAIGGHFQYHENQYTGEYTEYLANFPDWAYPTSWVASHHSWLF